ENNTKPISIEKSTLQLDSSVSSANRAEQARLSAKHVGEQALLPKDKTYNIISLTQLTRILSDGNAVVFDARKPEEFRQGHVHGARNIFGLEAEEHFEELVQIQRDTLIVIYCNNPECHLGPMLADFMHLLGFTKLYLYDGGWDGWIEAKMPIDSSMIHN
ncbi:MAG TPA: rhodanese-like domain-containing protein, partial [Bacteroidota bacterium]|nr:rhodanese-like domain-containing protein [Bacteroidota bacterium]